jgi:hypothetical protein
VTYAVPSLVTPGAALPMALFVPAFYADELGLPHAALAARKGETRPTERLAVLRKKRSVLYDYPICFSLSWSQLLLNRAGRKGKRYCEPGFGC